jgi:hypothetical protein
LTTGRVFNILRQINLITGSPVDRAERRGKALDPHDLIRIMPAEET